MKKMATRDIEKKLIAITSQLIAESGEPYKREIRSDLSLQRHLGIDSLSRAELFHRIDKAFEVSLTDRQLAEADTLNDILKYLEAAEPQEKPHEQHAVITSHGEYSAVDPLTVNTLLEVLFLYAEKSPNKAHIFFQNEDGKEEVITYDNLLQSSLKVANGLRERGLMPGETVAIMLPTHPGFFYTFFGTLLAGGIPVPIYPPFRMHMLETYAKTEARILRNAEVRLLVTFEQAENLSRLLKAFVPSMKHVVTLSDLMQTNALKHPIHPKPNDIVFIQYTSGSTADPKGVTLTNSNLISNIQAYGKGIKVTPDDIAVSWLPLYHDMGLIAMWLGSLFYGVPLILMTPFSFLNHPERWLWAIHYHRGTISGAPNFAYEFCIHKIDESLLEGLDLSSWRIAANGAEKVYPRTLAQFAEKYAPYGFKRTALLPVYGLAESTVCLSIPPLNRDYRVDTIDRKQFEEERICTPSTESSALSFVSCGLPIQDIEVRISDDRQQVLTERHVGNLQFRGPSSMQGYYNNPIATQAVVHDGWIDSGDLAYLADGEIFITGRRKDLIIKAGRNLYPAEIEELVGVVPGVRQGCVTAFGVMDTERAMELLIVVAETREKEGEARTKIIDAIKSAITSTLDIVPDQIILVAPHMIPKTSSGKLQRAATKNMYQKGQLGKTSVPTWLQLTKLGAQWGLRKGTTAIKTLAKFVYTTYIGLITAVTLVPMYLFILFASRDFAATLCRRWARFLLTAAFCPIDIEGGERLTLASPMIFTPNHASYIDSMVMLAIAPNNTRFIGKKELFSYPVFRTFMKKLGHLGVDRMDLSKGLEDTKRIERTLKEGNSILIFPEGTFGYSSGLRPFHLGAFKIATETNVPICPIALQGTRVILRNDEKLMWPGRIKITVCEPIQPQGSEWKDVIQLRTLVRADVARYCGEAPLDFIAAQKVAPKRAH